MIEECLLAAFRRPSEGERPFYLSPSNLGRCGRELLLSALALASPLSPRGPLREIFRDGLVHEDRTVNLLEEGGARVVARQAPVFVPLSGRISPALVRADAPCTECGLAVTGLHAHGHIDAVLEVSDTRVVAEHKALGDFPFRRAVELAREGDTSGLYLRFREYFVQLGLYLVGAVYGRVFTFRGTEPQPLSLEGSLAGELLLRNRNRPDFAVFTVRYDPDDDALRLAGAALLIEGRSESASASGVLVSGFRRAVERKLEILSELAGEIRERLTEDAASVIASDPGAVLSADRRLAELFARAARAFAPRTDRCSWCQAREVCFGIFGRVEASPRAGRRVVVVVAGDRESELLSRMRELEAEKARIESELKELRRRMLVSVKARRADYLVFSDSELAVEYQPARTSIRIKASQLPEDLIETIREVAPEAVTEARSAEHVRVVKLSAKRRRELLAMARQNELEPVESEPDASEAPSCDR